MKQAPVIPKKALHDSKAPVSIPKKKIDLKEQRSIKSPPIIHNDLKPTSTFAKKAILAKKDAQTTSERNLSSKNSSSQILSKPIQKNLVKSYATPTISSSLNTLPALHHDPAKVYLQQNNPRSAAGKMHFEKFEPTEPWNNADVARPAMNTRSISILTDNGGLQNDKSKNNAKTLNKEEVKVGAHSITRDVFTMSQSGSANIDSQLNPEYQKNTKPLNLKIANIINSKVYNETPLVSEDLLNSPTAEVPVHLQNVHAIKESIPTKPLKVNNVSTSEGSKKITSKRPPFAPSKVTKQASAIDSSMPSRVTSMTSLTSLDMVDAQLTLLDLLDITTQEKYKRLREAYTTQRQFRSKIEKENKQLRDHISILNKRMIRDFNVQKNSIPLEVSYYYFFFIF